MLHLIKMWLECPVEETDDRGGKRRTTEAKDNRRGIPQGSPLSPLLANLYMRRFLLGWKMLGLERKARLPPCDLCRRPWSGKDHRVVAGDFFEGRRGQVYQTVWFAPAALSLVTDIAMGEREPGFTVVRLLGGGRRLGPQRAVQIGHRGVPELEAKASSAIVGCDNVETKEPVRVVISDGGNSADWLAREFAEEESIRVSRVEAFRIVKARIPALGRGPFEG